MLCCGNILAVFLAPIFSILESLPLKGYTAPIHTPVKKERICNDKCSCLCEHYCSRIRRNAGSQWKLIALSAACSLILFFPHFQTNIPSHTLRQILPLIHLSISLQRYYANETQFGSALLRDVMGSFCCKMFALLIEIKMRNEWNKRVFLLHV